MVQMPGTYPAIHSVKTDKHISTANTICDTHTHTHCLSPTHYSFPYTRGRVKSQLF